MFGDDIFDNDQLFESSSINSFISVLNISFIGFTEGIPDFFSNECEITKPNDEENVSKIVFGKKISPDFPISSENALKSPSNLNSNKSKKNSKLTFLKTINEQGVINIDKSQQNKNNIKYEKKGNKFINYEIKNNTKNNQTNSNNIGKNKFISYSYFQKRKHDKDSADNKLKKIKSFLINTVLISHMNKLLEKCQESEKILESNSLKKKKKRYYEKLVQISRIKTNNTNVDSNKKLLDRNVKDILSHPNSAKKYDNKSIIEKYYNEYLIFKQFCDLNFEYIINIINDEDNNVEEFKELKDTYKEELEKRDDKDFIKENIKNFVELIKNRKERKKIFD